MNPFCNAGGCVYWWKWNLFCNIKDAMYLWNFNPFCNIWDVVEFESYLQYILPKILYIFCLYSASVQYWVLISKRQGLANPRRLSYR
jgi:hypothetical protein